jgi:hypothetical protein
MLEEVNKFLYMTIYLCHFIPGRSSIGPEESSHFGANGEIWERQSTGRGDKTRKPIWKPRPVIKWEWGETQEKAFKEFKKEAIMT